MSINSSINANVNIGGDVSGQIAIGNNIVQLNNVNGAVVNFVPPAGRPNYQRRPAPVILRPRAFPGLLGRDSELATLRSALQVKSPLSIYGEDGIGKTVLVRQAIHLSESDNFPDGVVYLDAANRGTDDLLEILFDAFHENETSFESKDAGIQIVFKPTPTEIRLALKPLKALIFIDHLSIPKEEIATLLDVAPESVFAFSSIERSLWGEGQIIPLQGLPEKESLALFERELGRTLTAAENPSARRIIEILKGHPLRILQSASLVRDRSKTVADVLTDLQQGEASPQAMMKSALATLTPAQSKLLAILAASGGNVLSQDHVVALANDPDTQKNLQSLIGLGLVQSHSPRYSLVGDGAAVLAAVWDLGSWEDALINYFVTWLIEKPKEIIIEESTDAIVHAIKKAGEKKRWDAVVKLGCGLERFLILWRRWQTWSEVLQLILKAAKALGDRKLEAWVLHQLGSRAMCLGTSEQARQLLTQAFNLRKLIGDKAGMAISQHNLNILSGIVPAPVKSFWRRLFNCGCGAAIGFVVLASIIYFIWPDPPPPTQPPPAPPTKALTFTPTLTPTLTPTKTRTPRPPTRTPTPAPEVLFDFVEEANNVKWKWAYDNDGVLRFDLDFFETPANSPEVYSRETESAYVGWYEYPVLEDYTSEDSLVLLTYPYRSGSIVYGLYDLKHIKLVKGDELIFRVGHKIPDFFSLSDSISVDADGVTFSISFYENDRTDPILLSEIIESSQDGFMYEWNIPIPPELVGKSGWFLLQVSANSNDEFDWAVWADAVLIGVPR